MSVDRKENRFRGWSPWALECLKVNEIKRNQQMKPKRVAS